MPIPTCEVTKLPFEHHGELAPHVLPCRHVFSYIGIQQVLQASEGKEALCPRCSAVIPSGVVNLLPRHKKLCTLVKLLTHFKTDPLCVEVEHKRDFIVQHDAGHPVYSGVLHSNPNWRSLSKGNDHPEIDPAESEAKPPDEARPVHVKVIKLSDSSAASSAWRELVMLLQVTQALGRSVVRTLGYVETPGESLQIIMEANGGSVLRMVEQGKFGAECAMRLAERVATALHALHSIHVIHAAICPDALCVSPHADASTGCPPPTPPTSGNPAPSSLPSAQASTKSRSGSFRVRSFKGKSTGTHTEIPPQDIRVMLADFASACALAPPDYSIPNSHIRDPLQAMAARYSPPERRKEGGSLNTQSDMYSWAATMYHLMTCQHPCVTESACIKGVPSSILTGGDKMDNIERGSGVPREVFELLAQCMHEKPEKRPQAEEAAQRLQVILERGEFVAGKYVSNQPHPAPPDKSTEKGVQANATSRGSSPTKSKKKMPKMPAGWSFVSVRQRLLDAVCLARTDTDTDTTNIKKPPPSAALAAYPVQRNPPSVSVQGVRSAAGSEQEAGTSKLSIPHSTGQKHHHTPPKGAQNAPNGMPKLPEDSAVLDCNTDTYPAPTHSQGTAQDAASDLARAHSSTGALAGTSVETADNDRSSSSHADSPGSAGAPNCTNSGKRHTYNPANSNMLASNPKLSSALASSSMGGSSAPVLQSKGSGNSRGVGNLLGGGRAASAGDHPYLPTQESLRSLSGGISGGGCITHADLSVWVDTATKTTESTPTPDMRPKHPLSLDEQAKEVLTKLGFPKLAVGVALEEATKEAAKAEEGGTYLLEDSLQILLADDVLEKSRHTIEREYEKLCRAARARAAAHPGEVASVTTEDAWTWVEEQAGTTFTGNDINMVLQKSEGAADDDNVTLEQFTHMVVRMFEQFFRILDRTEAGYLTQEDLRLVFGDEATGDVTGALRSAMTELDADGDGGVSLNELLRVGLAGVSSRSFMGSGSGSDGRGSLRRRYGSQSSMSRASMHNRFMTRVQSNDSLRGFQWSSMPAGGSFAARIRGHASMDRLAEDTSASDSPALGADTPLDQMHDITEELTTQLTGNLKTGQEPPQVEVAKASEPGDGNPHPDTPGHSGAGQTASHYSKGGDETGLMLPSQAFESISVAGDSDPSLFSRGDHDSNMPQVDGLSFTRNAAPGSVLRDTVPGAVQMQAGGHAASSDVSSMSPHRGTGNDSMRTMAMTDSNATLCAVSGTTQVPAMASGISPHMPACVESSYVSGRSTQKKPKDGLNMQSAVVEGTAECEHSSQIELGAETHHLLSKVREVEVAVDGGPFGSPSEPVGRRPEE